MSDPSMIDTYHTDVSAEEWDAGPFGMDGFDTTVAKMKDTGLPMAIGIVCDCIKVPRHPYLLASQHPGNQFRLEHTFHITLEHCSKVTGNPGFMKASDLEALKSFVATNLQSLLNHWEQKIDSLQILKLLK